MVEVVPSDVARATDAEHDSLRHEGDQRSDAGTSVDGATYDGWLFRIPPMTGDFPSHTTTKAHDRRTSAASMFTPSAAPLSPMRTLPPARIAGSDDAAPRARAGTLPLALTPPSPRDVATPYRVRLVVRWDSRPSPTVRRDPDPSRDHRAWQSRALPVPGGSCNVTPTASQPPTGPGPEIFTFVGGWAYDPRTTATQFSLALNSTGDPDGLPCSPETWQR